MTWHEQEAHAVLTLCFFRCIYTDEDAAEERSKKSKKVFTYELGHCFILTLTPPTRFMKSKKKKKEKKSSGKDKTKVRKKRKTYNLMRIWKPSTVTRKKRTNRRKNGRSRVNLRKRYMRFHIFCHHLLILHHPSRPTDRPHLFLRRKEGMTRVIRLPPLLQTLRANPNRGHVCLLQNSKSI